MERITHKSSAYFDVCGNRSLIISPLFPRGLNSNGDCIRYPTGRPFEPTVNGPLYACPLYFVNSGL